VPPHRAGRFIAAIAVSLLLVLSAPFVGQIRSEIRRAFPGEFVLIIGGVIAIALLAAIVAAVRKIQNHKARRYGAIAMAVLVAAAYAAVNAGGNPQSNVVELFHFLEYGLVALLFYRAWQPAGDVSIVPLTLCSGAIVGIVEEWFQWLVPNRVGEMKDVLLNLVAIGTGLLFAAAVDPPDRWSTGLSATSRRKVALMLSATLGTFALFLHIVHFGHRIQDPEIGAFASRWSDSRLLGLQSEKRTEWAVSPPPVQLKRLSREDQYLTEGIQHVRERNLLWDAGNIRGAWRENRILEKYYEPVLDTPTHEGAGHRWSPGQRADAASRAAGDPDVPYVSNAYPYRILTWPPAVLWSGVTVIVVLLLLISRRP
jgi:VanZ family protein